MSNWPAHPMLWVGSASWAGGAAAWAMDAKGVPWAARVMCAVVVLAVGAAAWPRATRSGAAVVTVLVACGLGAGGAAVTEHLSATRPAQLRSVEGGAPVELLAVIRSVWDGERAIVRLEHLVIGGEPLRLRAPAVLIDHSGITEGLPRGGVLRARGTLLPLQSWREPGIAVRIAGGVSRAPPTGALARAAELRQRMWAALSGVSPDAASLIAGLAVGDDSRQSAGLESAMRDSGLSHLTAVSGGNIAILAGAVSACAAAVGAGLAARAASALLAVSGYAWFVGPEPSVLRAAAMGCIALLGVLRGTRGSSWSALGSAMLLLVALCPGLVLSWGFALSVAATAGILAMVPAWDRWSAPVLDRGPRWLPAAAAACAVTGAAQLATAPLLVAMTGRLSLIGPLANLLAAPLVVPITLGGLGVVLASVVDPRLGLLVAAAVEPFAAALAGIARWAESVPNATAEIGAAPSGRVGLAVLIPAAGVGIIRLWRGRRAARASPKR